MAQLTIETDIAKLLASMDGWKHGDTPTFNDLFASALLYAETHPSKLYWPGSFVQRLARSLKDPLPTIRRYCHGVSRPHPVGQPSAVATLRKRLLEVRDAYDAGTLPPLRCLRTPTTRIPLKLK